MYSSSLTVLPEIGGRRRIRVREVPPVSWNRSELIDRIRSTRDELEALIADLTPDQMTEPGVAEEWSIKDMLAHIAWYEGEEAEFYGETGAESSPLWDEPQDPRNQILFEQNRDRSLQEVLTQFRQAHARFLEVVEGLSEEDLSNPGRFPGTSVEWPPWRRIAVHSCDHDREHTEMTRSWLRGGHSDGSA